jgi:tRNA pseudouridine38-40 synthase
LPRYKLKVEYDGGPFFGWQRVGEDRPTVQRALEEALARLVGEPVSVHGAGRTDAGVHAAGQAAHVDLPKPFDAFKLSEALNAHLRPDPIAVLTAELVDDGFHARFSAVERLYCYTIVNRRADVALERGFVWRVGRQLDVAAMRAASEVLKGQHDFSTFRDAQCQARSPIRTLDRFDVAAEGDHIRLWIAARSFLHRQVRSMAGSLVEVGAGKWEAAEMRRRLEARDRAACGPVAPAAGLCLMAVRYD